MLAKRPGVELWSASFGNMAITSYRLIVISRLRSSLVDGSFFGVTIRERCNVLCFIALRTFAVLFMN